MLLNAKGQPIQSGKPIFDEVASAIDGDAAGLVAGPFLAELRQSQDEILNGLPTGIKEYRRLLDDWQVQSVWQQRRRAITSREWEVIPGGNRKIDRKAADWLKEVIEHVGWDRVADRMLYGVFYGHGIAELMYARDGRYVMVDEIKVRDRSRFRYGRHFELRLTSQDYPQGEVMPARKFWVAQAGADHDDDPYGMGLAHYLYWPVYFKRHGVKYFLSFMERWAQPTPVGKYQPGTPPGEQKKLLSALVSLRESGAVIIPEGMNIEAFEAKRSGTSSYDAFLRYMDAAVSKIILSQTMTTDDGSSLSQAEVHQDVAESVQKGDSDLLCGSFNAGTPHFEGPVQWLTEWNFPGAEPPMFYYVFEEPEDMNQVAERDTKLFAVGYAPTEERVRDVYGEGYERRQTGGTTDGDVSGADQRAAGAGDEVDFAEEARATDRTADTVDAFVRRADPAFDGMLGPVRRLLDEAGSLEEVRERLVGVDLFAELDADTLGVVLSRAMAAAELGGRYEVQEGE